jgi:glycosyltransferase involved in cell wall biosynthesis
MVGGRETGNETYVLGLIDGLASIDAEIEVIVYHAGHFEHRDSSRVKYRRLVGASPLTRLTVDLPFRGWRDRLDVLHMTYTAPVWGRCPTVLTVHDISYAKHPEWFSARDLRVLSTMVPWSIRRAARVITVSKFSREEIIDTYDVSEEKVVCVYNAAGPAAQQLGEGEARAEASALGIDLSRPFVLAVGNLQPRKNLVRLIEAFERVRALGVDADLVIAGPEHFRAELVHTAAERVKEHVRFTGYLSHRQLAACYASATAFAFPSLFEGFGIPALEAMAHGTPVICARAGALPEVCGDAALYFDPLETDSLTDALKLVLSDSTLRAELSDAGRKRAQQFSWRRAAEETLAVYRAAIGPAGMRETKR